MWTNLWLERTSSEPESFPVLTENIPDETVQSRRISNAKHELSRSGAMQGTKRVLMRFALDDSLGREGYRICEKAPGEYEIEGNTDTALLYGAFRLSLLRRLSKNKPIQVTEVPENPLRMLNHWDNLDGSIERGYSGNSFFFENDTVVINERTRDYARFLCSVGINGIVINNVNVKQAACDLINDCFLPKVRELSELFSSYGITLYLSLNYAAPLEDPEVQSADPLEPRVISWWEKKMDAVYEAVPLLGGFLVKADSEGRPGPFTYGRTQADGANMLARALAKHHGILIWRCFVYNCQQDWRDTKTDRARSAYDYFKGLDGEFDDNVVLQIKNGPMDFQVREPVSPLFGGMSHTNQMIEFQIAQEYTGQQRHVCYLIPWFQEVLSFDTCAPDVKGKSRVRDIVNGSAYARPLAGMCAVANTGNDENWTGHDLAAANLYGFGRLAFLPSLSAKEIAREWITLTYGDRKDVLKNILKILMCSHPAYEKYTSPLGIGWMVTPNTHYGPDVDGYEYSRWGTYHRADHLGIGVDRSSRGTGYATLYHEPLCFAYDKPETTPEELLLFFHHVPYDYVLSTGKTVLQHIYDTHFEGAADVEEMNRLWCALEGNIDPEAFSRVKERFAHQLVHAKEWRDVINSYFWRKTWIPDEKGRTLY